MPGGYYREQNGIDVYGRVVAGSTFSGTTTSTKVATLQINGPGFNIVEPNDIISIEARVTKSTTSGTASVILYLGSSNTSADKQIGIWTTTNVTHTLLPIVRSVWLVGTQSYVNGATQSAPIAFSNFFTNTALNLDFTNASNNYYITVYAQTNNTSNVVGCSYLSAKILPGVTQSS